MPHLGPWCERNGDKLQPSGSHQVGESVEYMACKERWRELGFFNPERWPIGQQVHLPLPER